MLDLDERIRDWRARQHRDTSLSQCELDELEDHLRARADLEMELNAVLAPQQAFAIARRELGGPAALEKEFAKAGKPRWRRWLVAGWATFAASLVLPVVPDWPASAWVPGWEAATVVLGSLILFPGEALIEAPLEALSGLTNLLMLSTLLQLRTARTRRTRWLAGLVSGAALLNLVWLAGWAERVFLPPLGMGIGYWAWTASFFCVAAALWMRTRELKPATPKPIGGSIA